MPSLPAVSVTLTLRVLLPARVWPASDQVFWPTVALAALQLFKRDLGAYLRVYSFLSQIFDYGATALEKRAIFFRRLLPLLQPKQPLPLQHLLLPQLRVPKPCLQLPS